MTSPLYLLDTHAVVYYLKGNVLRLGWRTFEAISARESRIVVPSYALEEIQNKFVRDTRSARLEINIPPTPCLKVLLTRSNLRVLTRGPTVLAEEFRLRTPKPIVDVQDIPIAAAALVVRKLLGTLCLVTSDRKLRRWAVENGMRVIAK